MNMAEKSLEFMKPKTTFGDTLKFSPYAWSKLLYMRDRGPTEVAGYGITGTEDPLLVTDFILIKQECTSVTFDLDPNDAIEHMDKMMDKGVPAWACSNILIHTHPGDSPAPSGVDEANFISAFSHPDWAMMFIIAEGGKCYCRLKINTGPGLTKDLDVLVDWSQEFNGTNKKDWNNEYLTKVKETVSNFKMTGKEEINSIKANSFQGHNQTNISSDIDDPLWYLEEENRWAKLSEMEDERILNDCQIQNDTYDYVEDLNCYWDTNGDVAFWEEHTNLWYAYDPIKKIWYKESTENDSEMLEIVTPNSDWAAKVVEWACQFADERLVRLEN